MGSKILVVDDSMMVRQQVKRAIASVGEVVEAHDGVDALERASSLPEIALVICDVNMPRMGGLDFLEAFRREASFAEVPVLMLTTEAQADLVARSKTLGAKGWIIKPFKPELLAAAAKKLVAGSVAA